jgi:hypothetical protein
MKMVSREEADKSIISINLAIALDSGCLLNKADKKWLEENAAGNSERRLVDLNGPTDQFLKFITSMDAGGCTQHFISHIKHSREIGARWVIIHVSE